MDAVLPELDHPGEAALGPAVLQVAFARKQRPQREHAIEDQLVVEAHDQHRQVLAQRAHEDREIRGDGGLADPALVRGDGEHEGASGRVGGRGEHGGNFIHPVGWRP